MATIHFDLPGATDRLKAFLSRFVSGHLIDVESGLTTDDLLTVLLAAQQASWASDADELMSGRLAEDAIDPRAPE